MRWVSRPGDDVVRNKSIEKQYEDTDQSFGDKQPTLLLDELWCSDVEECEGPSWWIRTS